MNWALALLQTSILILLFGIFYTVAPTGSIWQTVLTSIVGIACGAFLNKEIADLLEAFLRRVLNRFRRPTAPFRSTEIDPSSLKDLPGELLANLPHRGSELWVVLSSKGGVGKSLISLGLTELSSKDGSTLLVDFDVQNRGLTSLLNRGFEYEDSVMTLMIEFQEFIKKYPESDSPIPRILDSAKKLPENFTISDFNAIVAGFAVERFGESSSRADLLPARIIQFNRLEAELSRGPSGPRPFNADNAYFLRSRGIGNKEEYLFSEIARQGLPFVTYFLKSLCAIAGNLPVSRIILDCHGAHDMLTAGAILAADKTIVVSTTDPGCYEGTVEILRTVSRVASQERRDKSVIYVVNRVGKLDTRIQDIRDLIGSSPGSHEIVEIPEISEVREIPKNYRFGAILGNSVLAAKLEKIRGYLVNGKNVETSTGASRWKVPPEHSQIPKSEKTASMNGPDKL